MTIIKNSTKSKYKYHVSLDIEQDAINWYVTCNNNNISHGVDFSKRVPEDIYNNISGKTESDAYEFIIPFLKQKYIDDKKEIDEYMNQINLLYKNTFNEACKRMVTLTGRPLYRNNFKTIITTAPRAPYRYEDGQTWLPIGWFDPIRIFMHELLHFQFIHYWRLNPSSDVSKLSNEEFEYIKESLTIILDKDLKPLIQAPDKGYEMHKEYREKLHEFWSTNKSFNKLVDFGLLILPEYIAKTA